MIDEKSAARLLSSLRAATTTASPSFAVRTTPAIFAQLLDVAYMARVQARGGKYTRTDNVTESLKAIAQAMTSGKSCGLMLCGTCGLGKTTAANALHDVIEMIGKTYPSELTILAGLMVWGATDILRDPEAFERLSKCPLLCIEDLGREAAETVEFGNRTSPIKDLIERRYNGRLFTVITTNLTPGQIAEKYGERISDRFTEMLDKVVFEGDSFRQKK